MTDKPEHEDELRHELANAKQQKLALKSLLKRAADEIEDLAEANCEEAAKDHAVAAAQKFKRAASL